MPAVSAGDEEPLNIDCSREVQAPHTCSVDAWVPLLNGVVASNDQVSSTTQIVDEWDSDMLNAKASVFKLGRAAVHSVHKRYVKMDSKNGHFEKEQQTFVAV